MSEAVEAAPVEPTPLGSLESVTEFRERRAEADIGEPVAAEPAVPAVTAPPEPAAEPDPASEAGKALAAKKGSLQARIDEMARKSGETERQYQSRVSALEAEIAALKGKAEPVKPPADPAKPKAADFETYEDFVDALAEYKADVKIKAERERIDREQRGQHVTAAQSRVEAAAKEAHADFDETIAAFVADGHTFSPFVADAILGHPLGHELAYALAKDPAANARINAAPNAYVAGIEVGQVLAGLKAAPVAEKAAPVVSKAPAPVQPVTAGGATASGSPDPANISSIATWGKERKKFL